MTEEEKIAFMKEALKEAKSAYEAGEVPIGCVIVSGAVTTEEKSFRMRPSMLK